MTTILSNTTYKYLHSHSEGGLFQVPPKMNIVIPFNLRECHKLSLKNDLVGVNFTLKICEDFKENILLIKRKLSQLKSSYDPFGMFFLFKLGVNLFPAFVTKKVIDLVTDRISILFSNAYLTNTPLIINGKK